MTNQIQNPNDNFVVIPKSGSDEKSLATNVIYRQDPSLRLRFVQDDR